MDDNVNLLSENTGWPLDTCETFINLICQYLDSCGYFEGDLNIHNLPRPADWVPYSKRGIGQWLLDMALQFNMETGKEYKVELVEDRTKNVQ